MDRSGRIGRLIGAGLYSPGEVERLTGIRVSKIVRWFKGHQTVDRQYAPLWSPSIPIKDGKLFLTFRDLTELRVADAFIRKGLSPQKVRRAIELAQSELGEERPLSTAKFRTDGRTIFLQVASEDGDSERDHLVDLIRSQLAFKRIIEPSLKDLDFCGNAPSRWWIAGREGHILLDPERSFGRPIEEESSVPTAVLAKPYRAEGTFALAAKAYNVSIASVRRSVEFEQRQAA